MCNSKQNRSGETHNRRPRPRPRPLNPVVADGPIPLPTTATNNRPYIVTDLNQYPSDVSDAESPLVSTTCESRTPTTHPLDPVSCGLEKMDDEDAVHGLVKQQLLSCLGDREAEVVAIYKKDWVKSSSSKTQMKSQVYQLHRRYLTKDGYGCARFAWFATSKEGVNRIMRHGFGVPEVEQNDGLYGRGVYLIPGSSPFDRMAWAPPDEDGLRHVLLCRFLGGKVEVIRRGSRQSHPSSEEFTSGVDSLSSPKRYIVWSHNMNTHIQPEYLVSFKAPKKTRINLNEGKKNKKPIAWLPFMGLIQALSRFLPPASVNLIAKSHKDYKEGRIPRIQLIRVVRRLAGDELLMSVLKSAGRI